MYTSFVCINTSSNSTSCLIVFRKFVLSITEKTDTTLSCITASNVVDKPLCIENIFVWLL